ncbi:MAG: hypothetical protein R6T98_16495 [Desulfatiglandales bacterium]
MLPLLDFFSAFRPAITATQIAAGIDKVLHIGKFSGGYPGNEIPQG